MWSRPKRATFIKLSMKTAAEKVSLPVLEAFLVAAQKTVAVGLTIRAAPTEDREETRVAVFVEVRTLRIIVLIASSIIGAGKQAIAVTPFIGVGTVSIAPVVRRVVNPRAFVDPVSMPVSIPVSIAISITVVMTAAAAASVSIAVPVTTTIFTAISITIPVATPAPGITIGRARRRCSALPITTNTIAVIATTLWATAVAVSPAATRT